MSQFTREMYNIDETYKLVLSEENREQQHCENRNTRFNVDIQYNRFAEDWRHVNTIIWQLPSIAISIMGGIVAVAYNLLEGWPRIMLLSTGFSLYDCFNNSSCQANSLC